MVDVFISYARTDLAAVTRLARAVEAEGYAVWWDADLPPHLSYGDVITEKIGAAKAAIVVWSKASASSEWVRAEADMARNQKKLVQTALDEVMPPMPFNQIQFAEIGHWYGEADHPGWRKVKASLAELCGQRDDSAPVASPQQAYALSSIPRGDRRRPWIIAGAATGAVVLLAAAGLLAGRSGSAVVTPPAPAPTVQPAPVTQDAATGLGPAVVVQPVAQDGASGNATDMAVLASAGTGQRVTTVERSTVVSHDDKNRMVITVTETTKSVQSVYVSPANAGGVQVAPDVARVIAAADVVDANQSADKGRANARSAAPAATHVTSSRATT